MGFRISVRVFLEDGRTKHGTHCTYVVVFEMVGRLVGGVCVEVFGHPRVSRYCTRVSLASYLRISRSPLLTRVLLALNSRISRL
jgi:hypothetical protein